MEKLRLKTEWRIFDFEADDNIFERLRRGEKVESFNAVEKKIIKGNILLDIGANEIWKLVVGESSNVFNNTDTVLGVGDSQDAEDASQTDLLGSNKTYKSMDDGYPVVSDRQVTFRATFNTDEANYEWNEFVIKNSVSGICLNRKVESKGLKDNVVRVLEVTLSL